MISGGSKGSSPPTRCRHAGATRLPVPGPAVPAGGRDLRPASCCVHRAGRVSRCPFPSGTGRTSVIHVLLLVASALAIYFACEWFVNAVEWLGRRLKVGPMAVGSILAAFGTALPESVVTFVAVV